MPHRQPPSVSPRVLAPLAAPQHFAPPSTRELRAQAVQRLQAGLFGLAAILLLVGLANVINDRARLAAAEAARTAPLAAATPTPAASKQSADPLADAGVVPQASTPSVKPVPKPR